MRIVSRTETAQGGFFADPPGLPGRAPDGGRVWTLGSSLREVEFATELTSNPGALRPPAPWEVEVDGPPAFPAIRRLSVTSPEVLRTLPESLGARPGTRYLEAMVDRRRRTTTPSPVALDPGGDLAGWEELDWVSRSDGHRLRVTTDPEDVGAVLLDTLDSRAIESTARPTTAPVSDVIVDPRFVQIVGRVSGVIDADIDGVADPGAERPIYDRGQRLAGLQALAKELQPREFARRADLSPGVAYRASAGLPISERNVERALRALRREPTVRTCDFEGCEEVVTRANARYCTPAHADRSYRIRKRERRKGKSLSPSGVQDDDGFATHPRCPGCDAVLAGAAAKRGTCRSCAMGSA